MFGLTVRAQVFFCSGVVALIKMVAGKGPYHQPICLRLFAAIIGSGGNHSNLGRGGFHSNQGSAGNQS